jgi:hypothetical protein
VKLMHYTGHLVLTRQLCAGLLVVLGNKGTSHGDLVNISETESGVTLCVGFTHGKRMHLVLGRV